MENSIKLDIISISALLQDKPNKKPEYEIIDEFWIDDSKKNQCLETKFDISDIIYKNTHKQCTVYHKNGIICKVMNKKYSKHFHNVCLSCKEIGISIIYGYITTSNNNLIIFEEKIIGYPLISITSGLDNDHNNTFNNNHVNVPIFKIKICKFFIFKLIYDIIKQLQVFHDKGYCHGDIHTGNIIVNLDLYKKIIEDENITDYDSIDPDHLEKYPTIFTLIDYDCVFISPDIKYSIGNSSEYMVKNNRVYHSDKIGDIQRLCSIINLLITKYIIESPYNYEFLHKTFRFCKKIKKIDSSMSIMAIDPLKYFKDNIFLEKSIPRLIFSHDFFKSYMLETYKFDIEFKNIKSNNCYYVNTNSRKIGNDFWKLVEMNQILVENKIKIKYYYYKEVFIVDIPSDYKKEYIKEICKMD